MDNSTFYKEIKFEFFIGRSINGEIKSSYFGA